MIILYIIHWICIKYVFIFMSFFHLKNERMQLEKKATNPFWIYDK